MVRSAWMALQRRRWIVRWPIKWLFVAVVALLVFYPRPTLLVRDIRHVRNIDALVNPDSPALQPWLKELEQVPGFAEATPSERLRMVQSFVYEHVPYAFDWQVWGVVDYLPTVEEIVAARREDCDGRALIAASLLRRFDPTAHVVTDFKHMWVATAEGTAMRPSGPPVLEAGVQGAHLQWLNLLSVRGPAYGLAVYPHLRTAALLAAVWLALADPRMRRRTAVIAALVMINGVVVVTLAARDPWAPQMWGIWLGLLQMVGTTVVVWIAAIRARRRPAPAHS